MVGQAENSAHHWLNLTLAAGAALVVLGVLGAVLGGLRRRPPVTQR
jgi:energy-converting hydrogenase Eha subunit E